MPQSGETISVLCACGKKLKAPVTAVGRKAKCPACGNVLTIEAPPPPPPAEPEDDPMGALYDLADAEQQAAESSQIDDSPRCPKCGTSMTPGAVLCVSCGHDLRGKAKSAAKAVTKPVVDLNYAKSEKKVKDKMAPEGKFIVGLALSFAFALGGGVVWFLIAYFAHLELGFISIGIGALAGIGMQLGQKGFSSMGGVAAAGVTFVVLIASRFAVMIAIILPIIGGDLAGDGDGDVEYDESVVQMMTHQELKAKNIDPDNATDEQDEAATAAAEKKLKKMSKSEYQALVKKAAEESEKEVLVEMVTEEQLRAMKIDPDEASETQHKLAHKAAEAKVNAMSASQRAAETKRLEAAEEDRAKAEAQKAKASSGSKEKDSGPSGSLIGLGIVAIIFLVFGIKGLIFLVLALGLAYRTASGSVSG